MHKMYVRQFVALWHPVSAEQSHRQLPIFVSQVISSEVMIKTLSYSGWRQYILQIIHMVLDGFHGLLVINLTRCINTLVKLRIHIFKKRKKKKTPQLGWGCFFTRRSCTVSVLRCCLTLLPAQPSDTKTLTSIHCGVQWVSESTLNFWATCSS